MGKEVVDEIAHLRRLGKYKMLTPGHGKGSTHYKPLGHKYKVLG